MLLLKFNLLLISFFRLIFSPSLSEYFEEKTYFQRSDFFSKPYFLTEDFSFLFDFRPESFSFQPFTVFLLPLKVIF